MLYNPKELNSYFGKCKEIDNKLHFAAVVHYFQNRVIIPLGETSPLFKKIFGDDMPPLTEIASESLKYIYN